CRGRRSRRCSSARRRRCECICTARSQRSGRRWGRPDMATHPDPELEQFRDLLADLARAVERPPDVHWGAYRAELRAKLEARLARRRAWWRRPVPLALSASLAGALVVFTLVALQSQRPSGTGADRSEERRVGKEW